MRCAARFLGAWLLCLPAACGQGASAALPRPAAEKLDPLVRQHVERALAACERGEAGALVELAKLYDGNNLDEFALAAYELCLARPEGAGERAAELHFHRGRVLAELERAAEAERAFAAAIALGDTHPATFWRRGQVLLELGRLEEARTDLERALALEPGSVQARLALARVELLADRPADVLTTLAPLVAAQPDERFVHGLLGRARLALGDEAGSRAEFALEERATRGTSSDTRTSEVK